ncbi:hypothetical protein [Bradyrhizobium cosmicum]|uniref:hypothetical protein n=1 Tax=Bradyrhizobium cosmicum TaxID=1404864 RepID=UPI001162B7B8|nr:hypothetical protein [Bradyrhizobium cosmicum]QDP26846.1 hypothetical protein FNV92_33925 [Bradyrhizobium cosmicum]
MNPDKIIIKFEDVAEQLHGPVKRLVGFVQAKNMLSLFDAADLDANPRSAKAGPVTQAIFDSIEKDPDIFPFKTKGILIGSSEYEALQRNRYQLLFASTAIEGVLDGGHNMLAIGTYILSCVVEDEKVLKKIKLWDDFKSAWNTHRAAVQEIREELTFLVPVEVLVPSDIEDDEVVADFTSSLLEICAARNNNAELTLETKANQKGFYEEIKKALPASVSSRIEWKTNMTGGDVKVRDIIALAWIPLTLIKLPGKVKSPSPQNIYRNKGECAKLFDDMMDDHSVSKPQGGPIHELHNASVASAIKVLGDLPSLYDKIYAEFPKAYNNWGDFGRMRIVRIFDPAKKGDKSGKYMRSQPETHFTEQPVKYRYPDGLIMPLVYGLQALMKVEDDKVVWATDPKVFLDKHLKEIAGAYKLVLEMSGYDPQKVGKNETSYKIALSEFEKALLKQGSKAA